MGIVHITAISGVGHLSCGFMPCCSAVLYRVWMPSAEEVFHNACGTAGQPFFVQTAPRPPCKKGSGLWGISTLLSASFTAYPSL